ncbi:MAG: glycerophosphodiester phosphodiesterase family protein [Candidatus Poseidoniaceae archaeon]|jgi:hypothetical protein|nr:glycerophosphodiester phosphodiesterase family protein [Candidatus Poseidoniaceae archaeon]
MVWVQPPENTHHSLVEAINRFDGVEFDLRLTSDNELIIHHDNKISIPSDQLEGRSPYIEHWSLDELTDIGFTSLNNLMDDKKWLEPWRDQSRSVILEIKRPSPKVVKDTVPTMAKVMKLATNILDDAKIPNESSVFYAFHREMSKIVKSSGSNRSWSRLLPVVARSGSHNSKRIRAIPEFVYYSFGRLLRTQKNSGSPMMPCAVDYFEGIKRFTHLGAPIGLTGSGRKRLDKIRGDYPVYVWPGHPHLERKLIEAGCSVLTDYAEPNLTLPDGSIRWERPATMPLTQEQWKDLGKGIFPKDVPQWHEENEGVLGWRPARMIGHRGCGKTTRPIFHSM